MLASWLCLVHCGLTLHIHVIMEKSGSSVIVMVVHWLSDNLTLVQCIMLSQFNVNL